MAECTQKRQRKDSQKSNKNKQKNKKYAVLVDEVQKGSIENIEIITAGENYEINDEIVFTSESGLKAKARVSNIDVNGGITEIAIINNGYDYQR